MPGKKTGRPRAAPEEKRSEIVVTRWTPVEAEELDGIAAELAPGAPDALTRADVLRALVAAYRRERTKKGGRQ